MGVKEIEKIIARTAKKVAKETVDQVKAELEYKPGKKNYFKETEKLLYAYPALKERIENGVYYPTGRSSDVVKIVHGGGERKPSEEVAEEIAISRERSYERTKARVDEIEYALNQVENDELYAIVELHYFNEMEWEDVSKEVNCSLRTVYRHRKRLINRISVFIFGADAL